MKIIITEEINDSIELIKKTKKELQYLVGSNYTIEVKKDNPVPSIDIDKIYEEFCELSDKYSILPFNKQTNKYFSYDSGESVDNFIKFFKSKQNGVETDKEEPKTIFL